MVSLKSWNYPQNLNVPVEYLHQPKSGRWSEFGEIFVHPTALDACWGPATRLHDPAGPTNILVTLTTPQSKQGLHPSPCKRLGNRSVPLLFRKVAWGFPACCDTHLGGLGGGGTRGAAAGHGEAWLPSSSQGLTAPVGFQHSSSLAHTRTAWCRDKFIAWVWLLEASSWQRRCRRRRGTMACCGSGHLTTPDPKQLRHSSPLHPSD